MHPSQSDKSVKPHELPLVSDSLRLVCLALVVASAAILFRIVSMW